MNPRFCRDPPRGVNRASMKKHKNLKVVLFARAQGRNLKTRKRKIRKFPYGPPGGSDIFTKMPKNSVQHQYTGDFIILQKAVKIPEKNVRTKAAHFYPREPACIPHAVFVRFPRKLMGSNLKTDRNLGKIDPIFPGTPQGKNWSFLQK